MRHTRPLAAACLFGTLAAAPAWAQYANTADCLTPQEAQLAELVNDYRQQNGLARIPVSFSLSSVGQWHVWDLETNDPVAGLCNLHSWSAARPALWNAVCYTGAAQAAQMWNKPGQITDGDYPGNGYENSAWTSGTITAVDALQMWKGSPGHNQVILNLGIWAGQTWRAMGMGVSQHYAVLWFGTLTDPLGGMSPCDGGAGVLFASGFES